MWLKLLQLSLFAAVQLVAAYWKWPGSGYAHAFVAFMVVFLLTVLPIYLFDWARQIFWFARDLLRGDSHRPLRRVGGEQSSNDRIGAGRSSLLRSGSQQRLR